MRHSLGLRRGGKEEDLFSYYGEHVHEVIETAQKLVSGTLTGVTVDDFVERGILAPAREGLQRDSVESIRMTVLAPRSPAGTEFVLVWESGHSVEARANFQMPVAGTFAGHALTTHATEWTNDVDGDPRWTPHPKARSSRTYGSLVSAPIKQGETVVGVLNVISSYKNAFTRGDIIYIEILASMVDVVWGLRAMTGGADA